MTRVIWPTSRGWVLGLAGVAWFLTALANRMLVPFLLACVALAFVGTSFLSALLSLRGIRLRRGAAGEAVTGQAVAMPLVIQNCLQRQRQPALILEKCPFSAQPLHSALVTPLAPGEERIVARRILALRRGEFALDRLILRSGDPAGLFYREHQFRSPARMLVLPNAEPISDLNLRREHTITAIAGEPVSAAGTSQDFYGVREYNPLDGLRHIHWKNSARFGRLMVREFERNAVMSVAVLLDAYERFVSGPEPWSNLEYQIRCATSICSHVSELYCNFTLAAGGESMLLMPSRPAAEAKHEIMYSLATLKPGRVRLAEVAYELGKRLPRNTVIFCLSLATPLPLARALDVLSQEGMTVRWFCARREAFAEVQERKRDPRSPRVARRFPVPVAQVHPAMRIGRALS